jgi:hypothetical protein
MKSSIAAAAALALAAAAWHPPSAAAAGPVVPLPAADRAAIEQDLGRGVLGEAVPAPVIESPRNYLRLQPHTARYRVLEDGEGRVPEPFRLLAGPSGWSFRLGDVEEIFLAGQADGSFVLTGIREFKAGALTRYDPPEPLLYKGLEPGGERRVNMGITVYDQDDPGEVVHRGRLDMIFRYLGAYRLVVPAGTFDTVLMKSTFSGRVGPADLEDTQYRFFAPGVGLVATIEHRHLSALIFYRSNMKVARMLEAL